LIDAGTNQEAIDLLVTTLKEHCCNFGDITGNPKYEPNDPFKGGIDGEGAFNPETKVVRLGVRAFKTGPQAGSPDRPKPCVVPWLYATLKHELVHAAQWTNPTKAKKMGDEARDYEAYKTQVKNAKDIGICPDDLKDLKERCQEASPLRKDPACA